MKCKKIVALALTGAISLTLAASAFAANSTVINGAYEEIDIQVSVPASGKAVINPYSMPFKAIADDTAKTKLAEVTTAGKIATNPMVLYNKTEVNLNVGATVSAVIPDTSGIELVSTPVMDSATEKQIQAYLEVKRDNTLDAVTTAADIVNPGTAASISNVAGTKVIDAFNNWPTSTYDRTAKNQVLISADEETTKENLAIMSAGKKAAPTDTEAKPGKGSFILVRLGGTVAKKPDEAWAATDTFDVNVAFTFSPVEPLPGGRITAKTAAHATNEFKVALPTGLTVADLVGATYKWELINKGETDATIFADPAVAEPTLKKDASTPLSTGGTVTVKCTVTLADGTMYASTDAVALT